MARTIFFGDSIIAFYHLHRYFDDEVINCGHAGYTTFDLLAFVDDIIAMKPDCLIYLAGTNDFNVSYQRHPEDILLTIKSTLQKLKEALPHCAIYVCSLLPCNNYHEDVHSRNRGIRDNEQIIKLNSLLQQMPYGYIDLFSLFYDTYPKVQYYNDSLHINELGYQMVSEKIKQNTGVR